MMALLLALTYHAATPPLTWDALQFPEPALRGRVLALVDWMRQRPPGWRSEPLQLVGNFVTERWCGPHVSAPACSGGAVVRGEPGTAWAQVEVLHYPSEWPRVFGLGLSTGDVPRGEVGVIVSLMQDGRSISGDGLWITFVHGSETLQLGGAQSWTSVDTVIRVAAPTGWAEELRRLSFSADSLKVVAIARIDALRRRAKEALASGEVKGFDEGPYGGRGIPPERTPRPLTQDELARERAALAAEIARRNAFVERWYQTMHARLVAVAPITLLLK